MSERDGAANELLCDMEADAAMEAVIVEYLEDKRGDTPRPVTIASGGVTWSCIRNNPKREQPKKQ